MTLSAVLARLDAYEKLVRQGVSEEDATAAARRTGLIQGPLEGVATAVGLRAARPLATALGRSATTAGVAGALTDTAVLRPLARGMATNLIVQPATEVAQDVGTELVERAYGGAPEDIGEIARQSAMGGAGLTLLLGPLAAGSHLSRSRRAKELSDALYGENADPETRTAARLQVAQVARAQGVGPKLAARIVNELRDKAGALPSVGGAALAAVPAGSASADAVSALQNLGFKPNIATEAVARALDELGEGAGLNDLVRVALKRATG